MLCKDDLRLPDAGWGELLLSESAPIADASWTDSGERRDRRQLKQRAVGEVRHVPSPSPLTRIPQEHLARFGIAADGRLFRGLIGEDPAESTIARTNIRLGCRNWGRMGAINRIRPVAVGQSRMRHDQHRGRLRRSNGLLRVAGRGCPRCDSNAHWTGFEPDRRTGADLRV